MLKKEEEKERKTTIKIISSAIIIVILLLGISYITFKTNLLKPKIDEKTSQYISFYNKEKTDSLVINNIKKRKDKNGKGNKNKHSLKFSITGKKNKKYEIVLYNQLDKEDEKFIKVYIKHKNKEIESNLKDLKSSKDGGKILYQGKVDNNNIILRMWISKSCSKKIKNNSFEVKIKSEWEK